MNFNFICKKSKFIKWLYFHAITKLRPAYHIIVTSSIVCFIFSHKLKLKTQLGLLSLCKFGFDACYACISLFVYIPHIYLPNEYCMLKEVESGRKLRNKEAVQADPSRTFVETVFRTSLRNLCNPWLILRRVFITSCL